MPKAGRTTASPISWRCRSSRSDRPRLARGSAAREIFGLARAGGTYERAFRLAANALELEGNLDAAAPVLVQKSESGADTKLAQPAMPASGSPLAPASLQVTRLASTQFKQFHAALLDAYTEPTLAQMTRNAPNVVRKI